MRYSYKTGVIVPFAQKFYKQLLVVVAAMFLATVAAMTLGVNAQSTPKWKAVAGSQINYSCLGNGSIFVHALDTVTQVGGGNFTGTGHYPANPSYTWDLTGNINGNVLTFTIVYTGTEAPYVYNATNGVIAANGSATATVTDVNSNCQSLTMPAGSFKLHNLPKKEVDVRGNTGVENQQGAWMFNRDTDNVTPFEFTTAQKSLHRGSLYVKPIGSAPANKFIAEYFAKTKIADVSSFSYDFKVGAGSNQVADADQFYLNVYANFGSSDPNKYYDCRYDVVPTTSNGWTTVTFDPYASYPVTTRGTSPYPCPSSPAGMNLLSANSTFRVFAINVGDTSASDVGLSGYLDKVVFSTTSKVTTYDFEPKKRVTEDCKKDGWRNLRDDDNRNYRNQGDCVSHVEHENHQEDGDDD